MAFRNIPEDLQETQITVAVCACSIFALVWRAQQESWTATTEEMAAGEEPREDNPTAWSSPAMEEEDEELDQLLAEDNLHPLGGAAEEANREGPAEEAQPQAAQRDQDSGGDQTPQVSEHQFRGPHSRSS